jgi:hypothetical protein
MSAGYFLYDWISCTLFSGTGVLENLHHLATLLGLLAGIMYAPLAFLSRPNSLTLLLNSYDRSGGELCACLLMVELSNPFMHTRFIFLDLAVQQRRPSLVLCASADFTTAIMQ